MIMKDLGAFAWNGLVAPAATPKEIVVRLNREIGEVIKATRAKVEMPHACPILAHAG